MVGDTSDRSVQSTSISSCSPNQTRNIRDISEELLFSTIGDNSRRSRSDSMPLPRYDKSSIASKSSAQAFAPTGALKTAPLQLWEGKVTDVNSAENVMSVILTDKLAGLVQHAADIGLDWVSEQDMDLVETGAVFYLTLYKEKSLSGTLRNSQELRFRRLPNWGKSQVAKIRAEAPKLLAKFKVKSLAAD